MRYPCNCSQSLVGSTSGMLNPNPDIAGIGVLVGLTIPALIVFILITIYYVFAVKADNNTMCTKLDESFLTWVRMRRPHWRTSPQALEKIILGFSDVQLVNGFSLLLSEFILGCEIDAYHWQILVQCVWFASATHLATIPILKAYLQRDNNRLLVYIRATLMTMVLAMLVSSLVPTGHPQWIYGSPLHPIEGSTRPALCFFDYKFLYEKGANSVHMSGFAAIWLVWSIGLVTITYIRRLWELTHPPRTVLNPIGLEREGIKKWNKHMDEKMSRYEISKFLWNGLHETVRTVWRLLESFVWHIVWLFMMMSWNLYLLVYNKWLFQRVVDNGGDNVWSFGQSMPLLLLIIPAMTIVEEIIVNRHKSPHPKKWLVDEQAKRGTSHYPESTRITVFLIFEFALLFGLLASINLITTVASAGAVGGSEFDFPFLVCLVAAPLVFAYMIHLADEIFKFIKPKLHKNMWLRSTVSVTVALAIGAAISFYFVQEYLDFYQYFSYGVLEPLPPRTFESSCWYFNETFYAGPTYLFNCTL